MTLLVLTRKQTIVVVDCLFLFLCVVNSSSPEHEVLKVSYCGQSMSVVRGAASTIALKAYPSYTLGKLTR